MQEKRGLERRFSNMEKKPRKEYRNVERSKAALADGLVRLLLKGRPFAKITVSELCEEAGVNRGTFYNHYSTIDQIAEAVESKYMSALNSRMQECDFASSESILFFFNNLNEYLQGHQNQAMAISRCLPAQFFDEIRHQLCKATCDGLEACCSHYPNVHEISREVEVVAQGIAIIYTELILGKSDMTYDEAAAACSGTLFLLFQSLAQR